MHQSLNKCHQYEQLSPNFQKLHCTSPPHIHLLCRYGAHVARAGYTGARLMRHGTLVCICGASRCDFTSAVLRARRRRRNCASSRIATSAAVRARAACPAIDCKRRPGTASQSTCSAASQTHRRWARTTSRKGGSACSRWRPTIRSGRRSSS